MQSVLESRPIIFNGSYFSKRPTGISVVSQQLAKALNQELVSLYAPFPVGDSQFNKLPRSFYPELGMKAHIRRLIWNQFTLSEIIKKNHESVLLSPLPEAPLVKGLKSVILIHDLVALRLKYFSPLFPYHYIYVPLVVKYASKILCNSSATAEEVCNKLKVPYNKIEIIKLGFQTSKLFPLCYSREPFLLIIARHSPNKNLPRVLEAFARFKSFNRKFSDYKIKIIGSSDNRYTPHYKKIVKELKIQNSCEWIEWVSDNEKLDLLNRCKALVIASLWEGFGLPALEALACGTTVIASNKGAIKEILCDKGLYVNPYDSNSIANAMYEVATNHSIDIEFKKFGPEKAKEYSWIKTARKIENIISNL